MEDVSMAKKPRVSVVGATGLVGRSILQVLNERDFPMEELTLFASARSVGQEVYFRGRRLLVKELTKEAFLEHTDLALASAGSEVSGLLKSWVGGTGIVVVDNSSAFRMHDDVPLIVPEINPGDIGKHAGYIANPNCSTIQLVMVLKPIADRFGLERVVVSTYQSVSGAGQKGMDELSGQTIALFNQKPIRKGLFPKRIAFNVIPQIGSFCHEGYTDEEMKVTNETRKILGMPGLGISCTAVRIPTFACHAESVTLQTEAEPTVEQIRRTLRRFDGVAVIDSRAGAKYPTLIEGVDRGEVLAGRIRKDISAPRSYNLWVVADNILKGAALNTVQIAELLL